MSYRCRGYYREREQAKARAVGYRDWAEALPMQNIDLHKSGITVTKDRSSIDTFRFVHSHPMGQSVGYFNLTKILFVLLMLLNAFVEVRECSEFDMRETDAAYPTVP